MYTNKRFIVHYFTLRSRFSLQAADILLKLYELFVKLDATQIEINPMVEDNTGKGSVPFDVWFACTIFKP